MEYLIDKDLIVDEKELVEDKFCKYTNAELDWMKMDNFIQDNKKSCIFYFDRELKKCDENAKESLYAWIDTGYASNDGEAIFISLVHHAGYYSGHFIGTAKYLCNGLCNRDPFMAKKYRNNYQTFIKKYSKVGIKDRILFQTMKAQQDKLTKDLKPEIEMLPVMEKNKPTLKIPLFEECKTQNLSDVTEEIFEKLMFPVWKSIHGLDSYIKVIGRRVTQIITNGERGEMILNKIGSAVVNTGLMDIYGNDILVVYRMHMGLNSYVAYKVIKGKNDYIDEGFSIKQINQMITPISFFENGDEVLKATLDDFDINLHCLNHIVEERRERLPEKFQNESSNYICRIIISALEQGLKIQARDTSYARPIYSDGKVSWLLPLRLGTKITDEPELVMVVRKVDKFFELKTILIYDDTIKDKITAMALYRKSW